MGWLDASFTYRSGNIPKYKVGDKVYKLLVIPPELGKRKLQKFCVACEITGVSTKKSGFIFREFTYTVKMLNTGEIVENVYESELYTEYQNVLETKNPDITFEELIDQLYEEFSDDYTKGQFALYIHALIIQQGWYNKFPHGFYVYEKPHR